MLVVYILFINGLAFFLYGFDKFLAKKSLFRISEKILLFLSLLGAAYGSFFGIHVFHHKSRKLLFKVWNFCMFMIWSGIFIYLMV